MFHASCFMFQVSDFRFQISSLRFEVSGVEWKVEGDLVGDLGEGPAEVLPDGARQVCVQPLAQRALLAPCTRWHFSHTMASFPDNGTSHTQCHFPHTIARRALLALCRREPLSLIPATRSLDFTLNPKPFTLKQTPNTQHTNRIGNEVREPLSAAPSWSTPFCPACRCSSRREELH